MKIAVAPEAGVTYTIQFWGASKDTSKHTGVLLKEVAGTQAKFKLRKKYLYARARIVSSKPKENPFQNGDVETAWTQPVVRKP